MSSPPPTSPPPMVWPPMPPSNVVPFPLPWGQSGCCPSGGMDALLQCYNDVQAATAFICSVMVQCVQNNPAVTQAIITAIENSGSSLPTLGVTNGSNAQPGQVGEYFLFNPSGTYPTGSSTAVISAGVLPPGDWDLDGVIGVGGAIDSIYTQLSPQPAGFYWNMAAYLGISAPGSPTQEFTLGLIPTRASITVPTLMAFTLTIDAGSNPGAAYQYVINARRAR